MRPNSLPEFDPKAGAPRWVGVGVVVGLHVLVGWALVSGLARKALDVVRQPVEVAIIDEVKPPPPPPPQAESSKAIAAPSHRGLGVRSRVGFFMGEPPG